MEPLNSMTPQSLRERIVNFPKADLHVHFEGTVPFVLLQDLARKNGVDLLAPVSLPGRNPIAVSPQTMREDPCFESFRDFIGRYLKITESLKTIEDLLLVAARYAESAQVQNIRHTHFHFSVTTPIALGWSPELLFQGLRAVEDFARKNFAVSFHWIFDIVRNASTDGLETVDLARKARKDGVSVVALGLGGLETPGDVHKFQQAFENARRDGLATVVHSGETLGAKDIWATLETLQPKRIGHGIRSVEDPALVARLKQEQIPLEVCPWSNIALGLCRKEKHPLKQMLDAGLSVILGSDDPGIFGKTLVDNYSLAAELGIALEALQELAEKSVQFAQESISINESCNSL